METHQNHMYRAAECDVADLDAGLGWTHSHANVWLDDIQFSCKPDRARANAAVFEPLVNH